MHDAEAEFTKCKKNLEVICDKICQHQILTKEIQEILRKNIVNISDATTGIGITYPSSSFFRNGNISGNLCYFSGCNLLSQY